MINEIVLWKVGRYAELDKKTIGFINQITKTSRKINIKLTREILIHLLTTKGIRLPMASTILRFKNPKIYQIIDQRVYRLITGKELKLSQSKSAKYIEAQINLYLEYLEKLRNTCKENNIDFKQSDRILYKIDKRVNGQINIKY